MNMRVVALSALLALSTVPANAASSGVSGDVIVAHEWTLIYGYTCWMGKSRNNANTLIISKAAGGIDYLWTTDINLITFATGALCNGRGAWVKDNPDGTWRMMHDAPFSPNPNPDQPNQDCSGR